MHAIFVSIYIVQRLSWCQIEIHTLYMLCTKMVAQDKIVNNSCHFKLAISVVSCVYYGVKHADTKIIGHTGVGFSAMLMETLC